jgi:type I restriction enzyme M protein
MKLRDSLMGGFTEAVASLRVLDDYTTGGIIADWWMAIRYDLKALAAGGFVRVLEGWVDSVEALVEPFAPGGDSDAGGTRRTAVSGADRRRAMDQPVVRQLIPELLDAVAVADAALAVADAAYKEAQEAVATAKGGDPDTDPEGEEEAESGSAADPAEILRLELIEAERKKERAAASKKRKDLDKRFLPDLHAAAELVKLDDNETERVVLAVLEQDLSGRLDGAVAAGRRELVATFRAWMDKYAVSLADLEADSEGTAKELRDWLKELGYAR